VKIAANILVVLLAAFGAFLLIAPQVSRPAYTLLAPANAQLLFPYESDTILPLMGGMLVTAVHVLFLSVVILWVRRWPGWQEYAFRWVLFVGALMASVVVFVALGFAYRHFSASTELRVYGRDLPVAAYLFAVFIATVAITLGIRFHHGKRTSPNRIRRKP
jgi:hypothetical protein